MSNKEHYYSVKEISDQFNVNPTTVYAWIRQSKLKAIKLGGVVRVPQSALDEFLKNPQGD